MMIRNNKAYLDFSETVITLAALEEDEPSDHEKEEVDHMHAGRDPHIWLSPRTYSMMADLISTKITTTFPTLQVSENIQTLKNNLSTLDNTYTLGLKQCEKRTFITSHAAFGYLARDYQLAQVAVAGISPEEEPSAQVITTVIEQIKKENLKAVFSEPLVSQKLINTIALETGATTYLLHPLESLNSDETSLGYIGIMQQNLAKLRSGLNCQ
jgi:zinc transport system substrate-binding protein